MYIFVKKFQTYQTFLKVTSGIGKPPKPVDALNQSNFPEECKLQDKNLLKDQVYNVPTLEELDIDENKLFPVFVGTAFQHNQTL